MSENRNTKTNVHQGLINYDFAETDNNGFFVESRAEHNGRCDNKQEPFPGQEGALLIAKCEKCNGIFTNREGIEIRFMESLAHDKRSNPTIDKAKDGEELFILRAEDQTTPEMIFYWISRNIEWLNDDKVYQAVEAALRAKKHIPRRHAT